MEMNIQNIGLVADKNEEAQYALTLLCNKYSFPVIGKNSDIGAFDAIIALGGDGFMLHTLHQYMEHNVPVYGMNCGTIGFLMNEFVSDDLLEKINHANVTTIHPLQMVATDKDGNKHHALAINEVSLLRKTGQAAKIKITVDGTVHMEEIVCDGIIVSTPAGSSAYNFSAGGTILPLKSNLMAITPISPFRPRRWKGAILPHKSVVQLDILKNHKRPVNAVADFREFNDIVSVEIETCKETQINLLFNAGHSLEERILKEQFTI